ncbi:MAG: phenylalanine--tRNA ligase subunit beta [Clostridia bacterium]
MKAPINWLREYVKIDMTSEAYADKMVMTGTGVEGIEDVCPFEGVVCGRVMTCEAHPDSDHLHVCTVDVGEGEPLQIVCGAPNVAQGQLVPVALVGAQLPGGVKIKKGKLRGVESSGMICSGPELLIPDGLYPHCGDKGILVFEEDYAPGSPVRDILRLDDQAIDFEILANRPDCLSIWGLARESSAVLGEYCVMPEIAVEETGKGRFSDYAHVQVLDDQLCPRYCARVMEGVKVGPSPLWMRAYLHAAGVRPINNIVDITNFVMLETGHPMHAFDLSKVKDHTIVVRRANPGETLTTLDGKTHKLTRDMLVIADAEKATGLAGIMGGEESEITQDTTQVLFESAAFDRANSRLTARALGIRTEASGRFEKGVCKETALEALERACMLVNMLDCANVVPGVFDHDPTPQAPKVIEASVEKINRLISTDLSGEKMADILGRLFIDTTLMGDTLSSEVPAWRLDVEGEADLAEEILRLYGYQHIPSTLMSGVTMVGMRSENQYLADEVKRALVGMGFYEALNFSFISPNWLAMLGLAPEDARLHPVALRNPLGEDTSVMRTTLAPSMLATLATNVNRGNVDGALFELSTVFTPTEPGKLPNERKVLVLGMYADQMDFYQIKDACVCLLQHFGIVPAARKGGDPYYHPGRKAVLMDGERVIGQLGEVHPDVAAAFSIEGRRVYLAEIDLEAVKALERPVPPVAALPRFPAVSRDLALVMDEAVGIGPVMETIRQSAGKDLESVGLFDIYRGAQMGQGKKSVAFALSFRASDRTLTESEIASRIGKVLAQVQTQYGAELRS